MIATHNQAIKLDVAVTGAAREINAMLTCESSAAVKAVINDVLDDVDSAQTSIADFIKQDIRSTGIKIQRANDTIKKTQTARAIIGFGIGALILIITAIHVAIAYWILSSKDEDHSTPARVSTYILCKIFFKQVLTN
jgi:hypothetical protein